MNKSIMSSHMNLVILFLLPILTVASITDLTTGCIPNYLICIGILAGIPFYNVFYIVRFVSIVLAGVLLHKFGFFGAGDIKLAALTVAYMGYQAGAYSILISLFIAAIVSLRMIIKRKILAERLKLFLDYMTSIGGGTITSYRTGRRADRSALIPMAPFLLFGTSIYLIIIYLI